MSHSKILSIATFLFLIASCSPFSQVVSKKSLVGVYLSVDSKFEKLSALTLKSDSTFRYSYLLGGCQDDINGNWSVFGKNISLHMDLNRDSLSYHTPDLNKISWVISSKGIKPLDTVDNGCFKEYSLHRKQN
jgi:hypothetical protein